MTAAMDVAYLDVPYVARAERVELMMRMSPSCWEDACHDCTVPACICGCHEPVPPRVIVPAPRYRRIRRCGLCGYLVSSDGHKTSCGDPVARRIMRLAGSIGRAA